MQNSNKIDYILQHITSLLTRDSDQILLEQLGIGYSQYKILRVLREGVSVKQIFIANILGQTEASISRQLKLLINKQLVIKQIDPNNKRVKLIQITSKGIKITEATTKVLNKYHRSVFDGFSQKKQVELLKLLDEFHNKMCLAQHSADVDYFTYLTES